MNPAAFCMVPCVFSLNRLPGGWGKNSPLGLLRVSGHQFLRQAYTTDLVEGMYTLFALIKRNLSPLPGGVDQIAKIVIVPERD